MEKKVSIRWVYLGVGIITLMVAGVIYAWSILKTPFTDAFGWTGSELALNFTLTMCFYCLGCFLGGLISNRWSCRVSLLLAAVLGGIGFFLTSRLDGNITMLYISYGIIAALGIGITYNVVISTVSAWFPDKKGLCYGALMMGFGTSALVIGNLASVLIEGPGWRTAYLSIGIILSAVLIAAAMILRRPGDDVVFPAPQQKNSSNTEAFEQKDFTTGEMIRRPSFWFAFFCVVFLAAVGNAVISFARDLAISVGAKAAFATTLVGILSVCNGLGRILIGMLFDKLGRKKTMLFANCLTILAAVTTLAAVLSRSLPICVIGLCMTGFSYGSAPTISSAFISAFYGAKYFPLNFSVMTFNLMFASFAATAASGLLDASGGYTSPFVLLFCLAVVSLILNLCIKKP